MTTRNGKIARLPFNIREELNNRLLENVPVKDILIFLNTDSTVRYCMDMLFQGRCITEQNVSEWRQGGYEEWLLYRSCLGNVRDLSEDAARAAITGISGEHLLLCLTASFADLLKKQGETPEIEFNRKLIVLEHLTKLALSIRKSEQKDERLKIDHERLEILREKHRDKSPSSYSPRVQSHIGARESIAAYPLHPKAAAIRRPPPPHDPDLYPNEPDWPPKPPECYRSGPSPDDPECFPAVAAESTGPYPGGGEWQEPNPETTKRSD